MTRTASGTPQDIDDAALSLGVLLCAGGEDLRTRDGKRAALRRIDDTVGFARAVLVVDAAYRQQLRQGAELVEVDPPTTMPTLPTPPTTKPGDRTSSADTSDDVGSNPPADQGSEPAEDNNPDHDGDQGDGPDLPPRPEEPEPEPEQTSTEVSATYDAAFLQIVPTAVASAEDATPSGEVTFTLICSADQIAAAEVTADLGEGTATVTFPDVTEPDEYTVVAEYVGTKTLGASEGTVVVTVPVPPWTEPWTPEAMGLNSSNPG